MNHLTPMLQGFIKENETLLDIGCGNGNPTKGIICKEITGIDVWDYRDQYSGKYIQQNITDLSNIPSKSYDVIFALDIIEHLKKEDGLKLIEECERIAKKLVFFLTPHLWDENRKAVEHKGYWSYGNKYNYHLSHWIPKEFTDRGYELVPYNHHIIAYKKIK